jgi:8-oxo-dGTP pyrophosphatase MutT (NUDIX family)
VSKHKGKRPGDRADAAVGTSEPEVRAAGGVIRRRRWRGVMRRELLAVVHRPRYDDWSFPKGKRDEHDEDDAATALREVEEETGFRCILEHPVGETRYRDSRGRDKVVRYWMMSLAPGAAADDFVANREVDELRWCTRREAGRLLTYSHDRDLLAELRTQ